MPNLSEAQITLRRLWPRLKEKYAARTTAADWQAFHTRLETHFPRLLSLLVKIYPGRYDLYYHLEKLLEVCAEAWLARAPELKTIDAEREENPRWFQSQQMLAGVCYVDLFAGDLQGLREKIPYFKELGLTYLHLMPLFKAPEGNSDGGYAVSSYREVNPALGNIDELRALAAEMRQNGISLCVDFIFNHTSDEHEWAKRALAGDPDYADFYFFFPDRQMPDAYERNVREIFPDEHPGAFSPLAQWGVPGNGWVWTTFHRFQWDLNYSNPAVFTAMAGEMLFIANLGVDVLRMDAVAFIWKRLGTVCENLPEAHWLIQAFNAVCRMAAPSLLFKSEAIVHPDDVNKYIHPEECQLSYNPLLMALLWNSLATRQVRLLSHSMRHRFAIHPDTAWVNYVRVHDDIGWTFSDEDAQSLGINGYDHRRFLNSFYTGRFPGSFARGLPFQENPKTGDCRISGTGASLAGLEQALAEDSGLLREHAVRRILLIHGVILSIGGLPLIYLGDELGQSNDYGYKDDHAKAEDSRWAHRPAYDWAKYARRAETHTPEGRLYSDLHKMIELRRTHAVFAAGPMHVLDTGNEHVFGFERQNNGARAYFLGNFSEHPQTITLVNTGASYTDLISGRAVQLDGKFELGPYEQVWLA